MFAALATLALASPPAALKEPAPFAPIPASPVVATSLLGGGAASGAAHRMPGLYQSPPAAPVPANGPNRFSFNQCVRDEEPATCAARTLAWMRDEGFDWGAVGPDGQVRGRKGPMAALAVFIPTADGTACIHTAASGDPGYDPCGAGERFRLRLSSADAPAPLAERSFGKAPVGDGPGLAVESARRPTLAVLKHTPAAMGIAFEKCGLTEQVSPCAGVAIGTAAHPRGRVGVLFTFPAPRGTETVVGAMTVSHGGGAPRSAKALLDAFVPILWE